MPSRNLPSRSTNNPSAAALTVACVGALIARIADSDIALVAAAAALACYLAIEFPRTAWFGRGLAVVAILAAAAAVALHPQPWPLLRRALMVATLLAAFVTAMNLLRETARTSPLIRRCGRHILDQPPRFRYGALTVAGNLFGILTAFGVINLLGVMIVRGGSGGRLDDAARRSRERRAMMALLRGFGHTAQWSPVAIPFAVVSTGYPALTWLDILPLGIATAALLVGLGWLIDAFSPHDGDARPTGPELRWTVHIRLALLIVLLFVMLLAVDAVLRRSFIAAAVITLPLFAAGWVAVQYGRFGLRRSLALTGRRALRSARINFPQQRLETTIITCAGFFGAMIAGLIDPVEVGGRIAALGLPPVAIPIVAIWLILALGHLGLNPVVTVAVLVAAVGHPEALGVPLLVFVVAVLSAWGLTQQSSPFNVPVLLVSRMTRQSPQTVGQRWNGPYVLAAAAVLSLWIAAIFVLWPR